VKAEFATRASRTGRCEVEIEDEALIEREDVAITVTHAGYIKRTHRRISRQGRGGKGRSGMVTPKRISSPTCSWRPPRAAGVLSSTGMAYKLKVWRLPEARIAGRARRW